MKHITKLFLLLLFPLIALAGSLTDYAENVIVDHVFRGTAYSSSSPANYYVSLYTVTCSDSAAGTEVTGGSYARVAAARGTATWKGTHGSATGASSGTSGTISNASAIAFPAATADWGTVVAWGIMDTASGAGNTIICAPLTSNRTITNGSTPSFAPDSLTVQIDN